MYAVEEYENDVVVRRLEIRMMVLVPVRVLHRGTALAAAAAAEYTVSGCVQALTLRFHTLVQGSEMQMAQMMNQQQQKGEAAPQASKSSGYVPDQQVSLQQGATTLVSRPRAQGQAATGRPS